MKVLRTFWYWLRRFFLSIPNTSSIEEDSASEHKSDVDYRFKVTNEILDDLDQKCIYVLNEGYIDEALYFVCPCGCDSIIELNLLEDSKPLWRYNTDNDKITIYPSVWRIIGCESHFFIREGRVRWAHD